MNLSNHTFIRYIKQNLLELLPHKIKSKILGGFCPPYPPVEPPPLNACYFYHRPCNRYYLNLIESVVVQEFGHFIKFVVSSL